MNPHPFCFCFCFCFSRLFSIRERLVPGRMGGKRQTAMINGRSLLPMIGVVFLLHIVNGQSDPPTNITFIHDAVAKGAVCLDGSPGAYYLDKGFGDGIDDWVIYLPGGGWCSSPDDCQGRTKNGGGSTNIPHISPKVLGQILSHNKDINPDFYNWNRVFIRYCDGASFMADIEAVDPKTNLHFRGRRIFNSVMEELISQGMANASNALLVGNSAGGLATILNCDRFRSFLPNDACRVKCISDSGFFIQGKDLPGATNREDYFAGIIAFHDIAKFLPKSCTWRMDPSLCLFPENLVEDIETPLFLLNSEFDRYQISSLLAPNPPDEIGWTNCTHRFENLTKCTTSQLDLVKDFSAAFLKTLGKLDDNPSRGLFITSCYAHDFIPRYEIWNGAVPILKNEVIQRVLGDWYFDRSNVQLIDTQHPYPIDCKEPS